jgi:hypothetical protein
MKSSIKATILSLLTVTSLSISFINPHPAQANNAVGKLLFRLGKNCIIRQCYKNKKQSGVVQPIYKLPYQNIKNIS